MIVHDLTGTEEHKVYQDLSIDNLERQYLFLRSIINAAIELKRPMISSTIIKALNYHAISCLHVNAGEYRKCEVEFNNKNGVPHWKVEEAMNHLINVVNFNMGTADPVAIAAFALWQLNRIHPFINGNGRTARVLCYYIICVSFGKIFEGDPQLPELIRRNRNEYVKLLDEADNLVGVAEATPIAGLHAFLVRLLDEQIKSVQATP